MGERSLAGLRIVWHQRRGYRKQTFFENKITEVKYENPKKIKRTFLGEQQNLNEPKIEGILAKEKRSLKCEGSRVIAAHK